MAIWVMFLIWSKSILYVSHDTIIILTADHGGTGTGHGTATTRANYTIPVLVWGSGVAPSADLYVLNPNSRLNPGTGRPSYTAIGQPIRNGDTGNLALQLLGLGPVDGSTINASQDLLVASAFSADFDANQMVDMNDLTIWKAGYGTTTGATLANGDATLDGSVDGKEFLIWQREYGSSLVITLTAVPEPDCVFLASLGFICMLPQFVHARSAGLSNCLLLRSIYFNMITGLIRCVVHSWQWKDLCP
ncbi:hypothetical protein [Bythopirellula polymerisocia]|uniref:Alkaline phosphatase n=1 Tax=Bythopirellula polymerisocia TaxID=2528003 RepID=A0A5C6CWF1_9BACT|nr:hypothetical protein [Bythopirellula polymerisocia]TWU27741.1 hypothetical protein Pla144_25180 [Bythopirellula polymerisocia]